MILHRRYIIPALAISAIVTAGAITWPLDHLPFKHQINQRLQLATGMPVKHGNASFRLLPTPHLKLAQVAISDPTSTGSDKDTDLLRAREIIVQLKVWPLLFGRFETDQVTLVNPRIRWLGPERPRDLWAMAHTTITDINHFHLPQRLKIVDGTVIHETGTRSILRRLNAAINWPQAGRPLAFNATAMWRGEAVDLHIEKLFPDALTAGQPSPLFVRLSSRPISFNFSGQIAASAIPELNGELVLRTGSLGRAIAWLRTPLSFAEDAGQLAIKGTAHLSSDGLSIPDARIEVEGGTLEGALGASITDAGRMLVSATLDATALDFNRLLIPISSPAAGSGWQSTPLIDRRTGIPNDLDIRLSTTRATIGTLDMQDVAAGLLVIGNKVELALNQASLDDGIIKGKLQLAPTQDNFASRLTGTFDSINASKATQRLFGNVLLSGTVSGQIALEGIGRSPDAIAQSLSGIVTAHAMEGSLEGVDLASVIRRVRHRPLATALDWRGGHSPFETMDATLAIHQGDGDLVANLRFTGNLSGGLSGEIGIADRSLALRLRVSDKAANTAPEDENTARREQATEPVGFPIEISGSWDYPVVTPDIRMLIERSNASTRQPGPSP